jgi:hypothetical protein
MAIQGSLNLGRQAAPATVSPGREDFGRWGVSVQRTSAAEQAHRYGCSACAECCSWSGTIEGQWRVYPSGSMSATTLAAQVTRRH